MEPPPVQYVRTSDGYSIAYGVSGRGLPLVLLSAAFRHVQLAWQYPGLQQWLEGLAARFQLVQFDSRGTGMATRGLTEHYTPADVVCDAEALIERLRLQRVVLMATVTSACK